MTIPSRRLRRGLPTALAIALLPAGSARAGDCEGTGPDLQGASIGGLSGIVNWGTIDGISAYSFSTNVCNVGDEPIDVEPLTSVHPVFAVDMFRLKDGRFEHIGMGWVKHMFGAAASSFCCPCRDPGTIQVLGVGCSDAYAGRQNGGQEGFNGMTGLGPRSDVNPVTGAFPFPYTTQGEGGDAIYKRLQIHNDDLDPALNRGAQYFASEHYIGPQDAAAGNRNNNTAYRPVGVFGFNGAGYELGFLDESRSGVAPIAAWQEFQPAVTLAPVDVPGDGRFILGSDCTDNGDGTWHYEYALYNMNSHRSAWTFSVPVSPAATVTDLGFHDVDYHSGEPYDGTDWSVQLVANRVTWTTESFGTDENANALRWGTIYNFRFDADVPPRDAAATIGLFRPGPIDEMTGSACAPLTPGDVNLDGIVNVLDLLQVILDWGPCPDPPAPCPADLDSSGAVDVTDLLAVILGWS